MTDLISRAQSKLGSFNPEARTVDVVLASETPIRRRSWEFGAFDEILCVTKQAINTERLDSMALLDSHDAYSGLDSRLGSIVAGSLRFEGKIAIVTAKISRNPKGEALANDLADGHVLGASVGYRIDQLEKTEAPAGGTATVRATRWTPLEISIVSVPADPAASTRSMEEETHMTTITDATVDPIVRKPRNKKERLAEIRSLAKSSGLAADHELLIRAVDDDMSLDQFRTELIDNLIAREEESPTFPIVGTYGMRDAQETTRTLIANAVMHRHGLTAKLEDGASQYRDLTMTELAREVLQLRGHNHRGPASDVVRRALHSTSDFPHILGDITRQTMMQTYVGLQNTYQLIATRNVVPDLREVKVIDLGNGPSLEALTEKGEYRRGTAYESAESFTMGHYGKVIGLTEAMIINDQLGAFARLIQTWAIAAARLEGDIAWAPILQNAKLASDNKMLFHADHGNIATLTGAPDLAKLEDARKAFRRQTDIDGQPIALAPRFLFTGTEHETTAQKLINSQINAQTFDAAVPQQVKNLTPVFEKRIDKLSDRAWFMFADPVETFGRGLQYALLAGFETPRLKQREGFDFDGVEFRLDHYFGAGLTDYRFAYYNNGVEPEPETP